jgi:ubiquinone/menaquinone biosynthesis C-methylase UbiE
LPDASVDAALLYFVWHHVVDRAAAARELCRVVPEWREVDRAQFRSEQEVTSDFVHAGWTLVSRDEDPPRLPAGIG